MVDTSKMEKTFLNSLLKVLLIIFLIISCIIGIQTLIDNEHNECVPIKKEVEIKYIT